MKPLHTLKFIFILFLLLNCLKAKKSGFDISSPSGFLGIGSIQFFLGNSGPGLPTVTAISTAGGGTGVQFTFSKIMDPTSITVSSDTGTFQMFGNNGVYLNGTITTTDNINFVFKSSTALTVNTDYSIKILKSVKDATGFTMSADYIHASSINVHKYLTSFGSAGIDTGTTNPDKFDKIPGLGIDNTRNRLILADNGNARVHFYDQNTGTHSVVLSGGGTYTNVFGVYVDSTGNFYFSIANTNGQTPVGKVYKYNADVIIQSSTPTALNVPRGIALNSNNITLIAERASGRVLRFDFSPATNATDVGAFASGLNGPSGVAIDSSNNVYIAEEGASQVRKYDSSGTLLTTWGAFGTGNGQFASPIGIAVDSSGYVYVAEWGNNRIQKFDSNGNFILVIGGPTAGTGPAQFDRCTGVAVDSAGNIYVADQHNHRVQKFGPP